MATMAKTKREAINAKYVHGHSIGNHNVTISSAIHNDVFSILGHIIYIVNGESGEFKKSDINYSMNISRGYFRPNDKCSGYYWTFLRQNDILKYSTRTRSWIKGGRFEEAFNDMMKLLSLGKIVSAPKAIIAKEVKTNTKTNNQKLYDSLSSGENNQKPFKMFDDETTVETVKTVTCGGSELLNSLTEAISVNGQEKVIAMLKLFS